MRLLYFAIGFVAGAIAGVYGYKKYLEKDSEDIYDFTEPEKTEFVDPRPQEVDNDYEPIENDGYEASMRYQRDKDLPPKRITVEEVADLPPDVAKSIVWYHENQGIFTFENNELIENEEYYFGEHVDDFVKDKDLNVMFIMNYAMNMVYEVGRTGEDVI